jgi:L-2-hydroxycarboxylate dehydrogenase (NAD+)
LESHSVSALRFRSEDLQEFAEKCFIRVGLRPDEARLVADHLVTANLRGVDSHGVVRIPYYIEGIEAGYVSVSASVKVVSESSTAALLDCGGALGIIGAKRAEELAAMKSRDQGLALVGAVNLGHVGMLAYYTGDLAARGFLAVALANGPAEVAPWGGVARVFGTNPISFAIPRRGAPPIIADMATSAVAKFKVVLAAATGARIPEGVALGSDGKPTTDPREALKGALLPFGGYKGYSFSLLVEVLASALIGAPRSIEIKSHPSTQGGFVILAIDPGLFIGPENFFTRVERIVEVVKTSERMAGVGEVLLPGEPEERSYADRLAKGIPIDSATAKSLMELAARLGVEFPRPLA